MKTRIAFLGMLFALFAQAATWTGTGDGSSWGDPANWGGTLPTATEQVNITTGSGALQINLGSMDRELGDLHIEGTGKLTISGTGALVLQNLWSAVNVDVDAPVTLKTGNNTIDDQIKVINFLKPVTALGTKNVSFTSTKSSSAMSINFRDTFTGAGTTILMKFGNSGSTTTTTVNFYDKVTAAKISCCREGYRSGWCYLHASGNDVAAVEVCYGGLVLVGENALPATTPLQWHNYYRENSEGIYSYNFTGTEQVAEAVRCEQVFTDERYRCRYLRSISGRTTLTLKGTSDALANCAVNAGMSLIWDPLGDYTQEFFNQASTTDGSIDVRRGTFRVGAGGSFVNLTSIIVAEGATFDLASDVEGALAGLTSVNLAANATLKISSTSVNAFAQGDASATLAFGASIEANAPITVQQLRYAGALVVAGTYGPGATSAPWATGTATITIVGGEEISQVRRIWTGAGDGATWSDDANWDTRAPYSRDTAVFPKDATITSDVVATVWGREIEVASGCTVTIAGCLGGEVDYTKSGAGTLTLSGSNTFTGTLLIKAGRLRAVGDCALGDNASGTIDVSKRNNTLSYNLVLSGVTVRKPLILRNLDDTSNSYSAILQCEPNTVNTIQGQLLAPNSYLRMSVEANAKFILAGGATFNNASFIARAVGAEVIVTKTPIVHNIYHDAYPNGRLIFACAGNSVKQYNSDHNRGMHGRIETWVNDALNDKAWFYMGLYQNNGISILDLCGTTQRISRIEATTVSMTDPTLAKSGTITSDEPAAIAFTSEKTYTNSCIFAGAVQFEQAGAGTVYLAAASTSTGDLIASAGTLSLMEGAGWAGSIRLRGGNVHIPGPAALAPTAQLELSSGSLDLSAGEYLVAGATDAEGHPVAAGRYAATASGDVRALAGLSGEGVVTILPSGGVPAVYTWTGAGDGRFSTAANWQGNVLPDFSNALGEYHFPGNGFTAVVDTNVTAKSFVFSSQTADRAQLVAEGDGQLTFADGSLVVTGAVGAAKSVVFNVPVKYAQTFRVRAGTIEDKTTANHALVFTNTLSTIGYSSFVKDGYGALTFAGDANDMLGDIVVSNGYVNLLGANPLGGEGTFRLYLPDNCVETKVRLCGTTVTRPLWFTHENDNNGNMLITSVGSTNIVTAKVTCARQHLRVLAETRSVLRFQGGVSAAAFFIPYGSNDRTGYIVVEDVPLTGGTYWSDTASAMISSVLACPGNSFSSYWNVYNTIELRVDNAIASNQKVSFNYWGTSTSGSYGMLDLTNTHQDFATCLRTAVTTNAQGLVLWASQAKVTGTSGSQLRLNGSETVQNLPVFTDAASYVQAGTATRWFRDPCTSTGELFVASGTLVMAAPGEAFNGVDQTASPVMRGGAWAGPRVQVSGGTLQIKHSKAFDRKVDFAFVDTLGKVEIPAGLTIPCAYIFVNGVRQPLGTYTAANFGDHVTGGGALVSRGIGNNTVIIFR